MAAARPMPYLRVTTRRVRAGVAVYEIGPGGETWIGTFAERDDAARCGVRRADLPWRVYDGPPPGPTRARAACIVAARGGVLPTIRVETRRVRAGWGVYERVGAVRTWLATLAAVADAEAFAATRKDLPWRVLDPIVLTPRARTRRYTAPTLAATMVN